MSESRNFLENLIIDFSIDNLNRFFRSKSRKFTVTNEDYQRYNDDEFDNGIKLGELNFSDVEQLVICAFEVKRELSERTGKKAQYDKAKSILKSIENQRFSGGIFIFYDQGGNFRFSLVYPESYGTRRQWNNFRRFTYFVSKDFTNKTFLKQIGDKNIESFEDTKAAFSITAVTEIFYNDFFKLYDKIVQDTKKVNDIKEDKKARDFVLLFTIRTIFIGFIQKKKWIGEKDDFIQSFFNEYKSQSTENDSFYERWLTPLFFEALNSPQGRKVAYGNNDFTKETEEKLQMAPYLNGGLFKEKRDYDDNDWYITDESIEAFFDFLFSHSFTIEENSLEDEDLQLNPEFLGIIFERLVNKADGAVYTHRTEVDLMCRLSLLKWLQKNLVNDIRVENLYELFFRESEKEEDQKEGSFSKKEAEEVLEKLESLTICDPAVGSGAFLVGMIQVLDSVEQSLKLRYGLDGMNLFERKKHIIKNSLYGVEVKEWAVWICQLRLWLSLFVDAPDELKDSHKPILPSLDFKVRRGDSLVQRVGSKAFPVTGHNLSLNQSIKRRITQLKDLKIKYYDNKSELDVWGLKERELGIYEEILDIEIKEKREQIKKIKNIKPAKVLSLFGEKESSEQIELEFDKDKVEALENEINELTEQKKALRKEGKPLVWSIEFAEVFMDKGGFDIIIGNPPYVGKEHIKDPTGKIKNDTDYKSFLKEMVRLDFPYAFSDQVKIDGKSDLYTYFYIRGLRLLNEKGIHTFICSNSWLDVGYGVWLQKFLLNHAPIELIIDNHAKRSFEDADVNTIISVIHAPDKRVDDGHIVQFVAFKMPFEEAIYTESLLEIENTASTNDTNSYRALAISYKDLKDAGSKSVNGGLIDSVDYVGDKWGGKYLRAPSFFLDILKDKQELFLKCDEVAQIVGYVHDNNTGDKYPKVSFIKSIKDCRTILLRENDDGVKQVGVNTIGNSLIRAPILFARTYGRDHLVIYNKFSIVGKEFYRIIPNDENLNDSMALYFNSTFMILIKELYGLTNLGGGALKFSGDDLRLFPILKSVNLLKESEFEEFLKRKIKSVFEECGIDTESEKPIYEQEPDPLPDRAALDKVVFDALELSEEERKDVYRAVCQLVWNRISKANSV